jgi:hypothetical protein
MQIISWQKAASASFIAELDNKKPPRFPGTAF